MILIPVRCPAGSGGRLRGHAPGRLALAALAAIALIAGCDTSTPPPRAIVPGPTFYPLHQYAPEKPMPPELDVPPPPFNDPAIITQQLPEETAFIRQYIRVGQPRFVVFVNRDLYGQGIQTPGVIAVPGTYISREQLDQLQAAQLDYMTIETMLADWLAADGKVHIVSPSAVHGLLTPTQVQNLQAGQPNALTPIAQTLSADVLVQVQVHPVEQTMLGLRYLLIAEAINTRDGASIGRCTIPLDPPLDKPHINDDTRFVARKLMDEITLSWQNYQPPPAVMTPNSQPAGIPMTPLTPATPTTPSAPPTPPSGAGAQSPAAPNPAVDDQWIIQPGPVGNSGQNAPATQPASTPPAPAQPGRGFTEPPATPPTSIPAGLSTMLQNEEVAPGTFIAPTTQPSADSPAPAMAAPTAGSVDNSFFGPP